MPSEDSMPPVTRSGRSPNDNRPRVTVAARSDKGRVRPDNQDNFVIMPLEVKSPAEPNSPGNLITSSDTRYVIANRGLLMGVFDGMGGVAGGQWAAAESARIIGLNLFDRRREVKTPTKPGQDPEQLLEGILHTANERIHHHGKYHKPEWSGMGSTSTVAWAVGNRLLVGQVGDSRAYLLWDNQLIQITRDQTLVNALVAAGVLTPEQAAVHPRRTELLECLGPAEEVRPQIYEIILPARSRLLMCSDGLHGPLGTPEAIREILAQPKLPGEICRMLVDAANARGGHDNITAIVADLDVPTAQGPMRIRQIGQSDGLSSFLEEQTETETENYTEAVHNSANGAATDWYTGEAPAPATQPALPNAAVSWWMWLVLAVLLALVVVFGLLVAREYLAQNEPSPGSSTPHGLSSADESTEKPMPPGVTSPNDKSQMPAADLPAPTNP